MFFYNHSWNDCSVFKLFILCLALDVNEWKSSSRNQNVLSLIGTLQLIHVTDETGASTWNMYINNLRHSTRLRRKGPQILSTTSYSQIKRFFFLIVKKTKWLLMTTDDNTREAEDSLSPTLQEPFKIKRLIKVSFCDWQTDRTRIRLKTWCGVNRWDEPVMETLSFCRSGPEGMMTNDRDVFLLQRHSERKQIQITKSVS